MTREFLLMRKLGMVVSYTALSFVEVDEKPLLLLLRTCRENTARNRANEFMAVVGAVQRMDSLIVLVGATAELEASMACVTKIG